jgi:hypothetical protein
MIEILIAAVVIAYLVMLLIYMKADGVEHSVYLLNLDRTELNRNRSDVERILSVLNMRSTRGMETCHLGWPRPSALDILKDEIALNNEVILPSGKLATVQDALVLITDYLDLEVEVTPAAKKLIKKDSKDIG